MAEEKKSFFARLREGLTKTRNNIVKGFDYVFSGYSVIDDEFYEDLEETMIMGDLGGRATEEILDRLKEQVNDQGICDPQESTASGSRCMSARQLMILKKSSPSSW